MEDPKRREEPGGALSPDLLKLLACPICRTSVREDGESLVCCGCGRRFPVRDGIPVMLVDEALPPAADDC